MKKRVKIGGCGRANHKPDCQCNLKRSKVFKAALDRKGTPLSEPKPLLQISELRVEPEPEIRSQFTPEVEIPPQIRPEVQPQHQSQPVSLSADAQAALDRLQGVPKPIVSSSMCVPPPEPPALPGAVKADADKSVIDMDKIIQSQAETILKAPFDVSNFVFKSAKFTLNPEQVKALRDQFVHLAHLFGWDKLLTEAKYIALMVFFISYGGAWMGCYNEMRKEKADKKPPDKTAPSKDKPTEPQTQSKPGEIDPLEPVLKTCPGAYSKKYE